MTGGLRDLEHFPAGRVENRRAGLHYARNLYKVGNQGIVEIGRRQVPASTRGQRGQCPHFNGPLVILAAHNRLSVPVLRGTLIAAAERPQFSLRIAATAPAPAAYPHRLPPADPVHPPLAVLA